MSISEYHKFDLHIHTDKSNLTKENDYKGKFCLNMLLSELKSNKVDVFSLTDHNIFNVEAYKMLTSHEELNYFIGIEFDILKEEDLLPGIKKSMNRYATNKFHCILIFKSKNIDDLNEKLLQMYERIDSDYYRKFSEKCDIKTINFKHRYTSLDRIIKAFFNEDYLIIAHGEKSSGIREQYGDCITKAQVMILMGFINSLEMSPNKVDAIMHYNKGFDDLLSHSYKGRSSVPYVLFSDNHQIAGYPNYSSEQSIENRPSTWIKGDCSFETLKLAFVDPESRIKIEATRPEKPLLYLEDLKFNLVTEVPSNKEVNIKFSSGLNTIVGGRSSGKSLLLNAIMNNFNSTRDNCEIEKYASGEDRVLELASIVGRMNIREEFLKSNNAELVAYTQDSIVNLFKSSGEGLADQLPFEKFSFEYVQEKKTEVMSLINDVVNTYKSYYLVKSNQFETLIMDIHNTYKKREIGYQYLSGIKNIQYSILDSSTKIQEKSDEITLIIEMLNKLYSEELNDLKLFDDTEISLINSILELLNSKKLLVENYFRNIKFKETFISSLQKKLPQHIESKNSQYDQQLSNSKIRYELQLENIRNFLKMKFELRKSSKKLENLKVVFNPIKKQVSEQYTLLSEIEYNYNEGKFLERFNEGVKGGGANLYDTLLLMSIGAVNILRKRSTPEDLEWYFNKIKNEIEESLRTKYSILENGEKKSINSSNMSPGKKASVFLEIKFKIAIESKLPTIYLIDQPEDNLDNLFITENLIELLRKLKNTNQIILVTHNASIAINSDSDNIIIAENDSGIISYKNSGIEDVPFRKEVCKLLDGGFYVFDMRYHKYDIPYKKLYEPINREEV